MLVAGTEVISWEYRLWNSAELVSRLSSCVLRKSLSLSECEDPHV